MSGQAEQVVTAGDPRAAWILRVLGVQVGSSAAQTAAVRDFQPLLKQALAAWIEATTTAGQQLDGLRKVLLAMDDPGMRKIAEFGLNALTGKLRTTLEVALREVAGAPPPGQAAAAAKAAAAVAAFRTFLATDKRVAACDACPTVPVSLRETYGAGLDSIERALRVVA